MKRWLLYLFMAGIFASCNDPDDSAMSGPAKDPVSKYAVSTETALGNLEAALKALQSGDTRAGTPARRVESIRPLKLESIALKTRSGSVSDADNLLYVVAFEDGRGSAVLGADTRVASVYAILDESVFTPADFVQTATRSIGEEGEEEISEFLTGLILDDALWRIENAVPSGSGIELPGGDGGPILAPKYWSSVSDQIRIAPMLQTKWHQRSPYNDDCDWDNLHGSRYLAGCVNISVGQLLCYNQTGTTITVGSNTLSWSLINQCKYGSTPSVEAKREVARFIHAIGIQLETQYGSYGSDTYSSKVPAFLKKLGYKNPSYSVYSFESASNMICTRKKPFLLRGAGVLNGAGHSWVVDGWNSYTLKKWETTYNSQNLPNPPKLMSEESIRLVHCNFGWGGACDGYYKYNLFDTTKQLESDKIDGSVGDYAGSNFGTDYKFAYDFKIIIYDK